MADDELRACEREVEARPSAASWARLGQALARAGRPDDAYRAAVRACALDPSSDARGLLRPTWPLPGMRNAVPWPGLRRLCSPRRLDAVPGGPIGQGKLHDLGAGRIAYSLGGAESSIVCVDLLAGRITWRSAPGLIVGLVDDRLLVARDLQLRASSVTTTWLQAATGEELGPARSFAAMVEGDDLLLLDATTLAVLELAGDPLELGTRRYAVSTFDLASGARLARWEVPATERPELEALGETLVVIDAEHREIDAAQLVGPGRAPLIDNRHRLRAFDRLGRERWRFEGPGAPCGRIGDELAVATEGNRLLLVDASGGRRWFPAASARALTSVGRRTIVSSGHGVVPLQAIDRGTLTPVRGWRRDPAYDYPRGGSRVFSEEVIVATRDAVLALEWSREEAPPGLAFADGNVVALDLDTGLELARVSLPEVSERVVPALVAGRLVLAHQVAGPPLIVVEEPT